MCHRSAASSSFVLAGALTGANGCGRSSLTRGRAAARTSSCEETQHNSQPGRLPGHRVRTARSVDSEGPHGRQIWTPPTIHGTDGVTRTKSALGRADVIRRWRPWCCRSHLAS